MPKNTTPAMTADATRKRAALIVRDARTRRSDASWRVWPLPHGGTTTAAAVAPELSRVGNSIIYLLYTGGGVEIDETMYEYRSY